MKLEATETINVPVNQVFEVLADYSRDPEWKGDCLACTVEEGDGSVGTKLRYVARALGRKVVTQSIITEYSPGKRVAFKAEGERALRGWRTFEAVEGGTRVTVGLEVDVAAFMGPLAALATTLGKRQLTHDLAAVKVILEHAAAA